MTTTDLIRCRLAACSEAAVDQLHTLSDRYWRGTAEYLLTARIVSEALNIPIHTVAGAHALTEDLIEVMKDASRLTESKGNQRCSLEEAVASFYSLSVSTCPGVAHRVLKESELLIEGRDLTPCLLTVGNRVNKESSKAVIELAGMLADAADGDSLSDALREAYEEFSEGKSPKQCKEAMDSLSGVIQI